MEKSEIIFNQHRQKIYNLCFRMTGNADDANDITQETFIQAFKSLEKFRGESQIYTWLYRIAKNKCIRFLENKKRSTILSLQELVDKASSPVDNKIPEEQKLRYILQVKDGCLSGLLRCLSIHQRLAFILNILLHLPISQVASVLGKSENASRVLVHRSKQNIKLFLCKNCSLYDSKNKCRCENLINFSLKQGWISPDSEPKDIIRAEEEVKALKDVAGLFKTLDEKHTSEEFNKRFKLLLEHRKDFLIFSNKKVK